VVSSKARIEGTFELEKIMIIAAMLNVSNEQEMAHESQGQQLIVVMKWSNVHGAKEHSHSKLMVAKKKRMSRNHMF
jgi:hypothetical protein